MWGFTHLDKLFVIWLTIEIFWVLEFFFHLIFVFFGFQLRPNLYFFWQAIKMVLIFLFIASVWIDLGPKFSVLTTILKSSKYISFSSEHEHVLPKDNRIIWKKIIFFNCYLHVSFSRYVLSLSFSFILFQCYSYHHSNSNNHIY